MPSNKLDPGAPKPYETLCHFKGTSQNHQEGQHPSSIEPPKR